MIAVLSDSHVPGRAEGIPEKFLESLEEAEVVVHCGDFEEEEVYEKLEGHGKLVAVKGNCDLLDLPPSETFEYRDVEFGVYHGTGIQPRGHLPTLVETARKLDVEVLLTGHTHKQLAEKREGKIILNPGTCTGARGGTHCGGNPEMMTIEMEDREMIVEKISLENSNIVTEKTSFSV